MPENVLKLRDGDTYYFRKIGQDKFSAILKITLALDCTFFYILPFSHNAFRHQTLSDLQESLLVDNPLPVDIFLDNGKLSVLSIVNIDFKEHCIEFILEEGIEIYNPEDEF